MKDLSTIAAVAFGAGLLGAIAGFDGVQMITIMVGSLVVMVASEVWG